MVDSIVGSGAKGVVRGICRLAIASVVATNVTWHQAAAQSAENANRTVNLNYVYASELGFGGYTVGGLTADVFTLPYRTTIPLPGSSGWAVRLSVPLQLGIYDFKAADTDGSTIKLNQQSVEPGSSVAPAEPFEFLWLATRASERATCLATGCGCGA